MELLRTVSTGPPEPLPFFHQSATSARIPADTAVIVSLCDTMQAARLPVGPGEQPMTIAGQRMRFSQAWIVGLARIFATCVHWHEACSSAFIKNTGENTHESQAFDTPGSDTDCRGIAHRPPR